jgi:hypothetical protein
MEMERDQNSQNSQGLLSCGTQAAMMLIAPLRIPDDPIPATALAMMKKVEEVETAQSKEPSSNIAIPVIMTVCKKSQPQQSPEVCAPRGTLLRKRAYSFPVIGWREQLNDEY